MNRSWRPVADTGGRPAPPLTGVSADLADLVSLLLAKDPDDRPADVGSILGDALVTGAGGNKPVTADEAAFDDFGQEAVPQQSAQLVAAFGPGPQRLRAAPRRGRRWLVGAGAAAAVLAVLPIAIRPGGDPSADRTPAGTANSPVVTPTGTPPVRVDLAVPEDRGSQVTLHWQAPPGLDFAVAVDEQARRSAARSARAT